MTGVEVLKSPSDRKQYRYLKLDNGMAVLLIHDPEIAQAAAEATAAAAADGDAPASAVRAWN